VLPILLLGACATQTPAPSSNVLAGVLKPVPNYSRAPCDMQREWAAHNSRVASVEKGATVVYKAPCDVDPKPRAPAASPVKTSEPVPAVDSDRAQRVADLGAEGAR
jgi:hypothetical protein